MKIALLFSAWAIGPRPLDFNKLFSSERGLTGSDLGIVMVAAELVKLGHEVALFVSHVDKQNKPATWKGVRLYNIEECNPTITDHFDVLMSWSDPNIFTNVSQKPIKVVYQMLNDFNYVISGFSNVPDLWITVSDGLQKHLMQSPNAPSPEKWGSVVPLGCEPSWYEDAPRAPGRVVWTSSPDRGLHLLLQQWPKIKAAVPEANLRIFYNFNYDHVIKIEPQDSGNYTTTEMAQRARYIINAVKKLKHLGVEQVGSISRDRMAKELSEAKVLAYPCSTILFSEGFSVSILESCAAGVVPVIAGQDCLGDIYKNVVPMVGNTPEIHLDEFTQLVIRGLIDEPYRQEVITKCKAFAHKLQWSNVAKKLENNIIQYRQTHAK